MCTSLMFHSTAPRCQSKHPCFKSQVDNENYLHRLDSDIIAVGKFMNFCR